MARHQLMFKMDDTSFFQSKLKMADAKKKNLQILLLFPCRWASVGQHDLLPNVLANLVVLQLNKWALVSLDLGPEP